MPNIGEEGQKKLKQSHILVAGLRGLDSLSSIYWFHQMAVNRYS
jgi:hypothetical protein